MRGWIRWDVPGHFSTVLKFLSVLTVPGSFLQLDTFYIIYTKLFDIFNRNYFSPLLLSSN